MMRWRQMNDYRPLARETALRRGIDPYIFEAQINQESEFKEDAVSSAGAQGLGQLMPGTAAELGVKNPFDPVQNLDGAARYLKQMLNQFGDYRKALAAYNAGPGTVARAGGVPNIPETINYVDIITKGAARLRARGGGQSQPPAALTAQPPGPRTDGNPGETGSGMGFRKAADPLVATALAGLLPQADANPLATLQTAFQRLAGAAGTSGFGAALRHAMAPLGKLQAHGAVDDLHDQMSAAIFGTPRRMTATAGSDGAMTPFQPAKAGVGVQETAATTRNEPSAEASPSRTAATGGRRIPLQALGQALRSMGFKVAENRLLGTPVGRHSQGSLHYDDDAIDLTIQAGSPLLQRPYPFKKNPVDADWPQITQYWGEVFQKVFPQKQILHRGVDPGGHSEHIHFGMPGLKHGAILTPEAEQLLAPYLRGT